MTCYTLRDKDGKNQGFMCGDFGTPCHCGDVAPYLCDFPVGDGKTCDAPLCENHAAEIGIELHYCHAHEAMWNAFCESGGLKQELDKVIPFRKRHRTTAASPALVDQRNVEKLKRVRHLLRGLPRERDAVRNMLLIPKNEADELLELVHGVNGLPSVFDR